MPQYKDNVTTPYNMNTQEVQTLSEVKHNAEAYLDNQYNKLGQMLEQNHQTISKSEGQTALHQLLDQKQLMTDLSDKVAIILHLLKNDGVTRLSAKELSDLVLLHNGKDYHATDFNPNIETVLSYGTDYTNPDIRKSLENVIRYFANAGQVRIVYAVLDKGGNIIGYQVPEVELLPNKNSKIKGLKLLPTIGEFKKEKLSKNKYKLWKKENEENAITITPNNYKDYFAELYDIIY